VKAYLNGRLVDLETAAIDVSDRGFTLGDGLYETIAVRLGRPARLAAHLARLRLGAQVIGLDIPGDDARLAAALESVIAANDIKEGVLRLTVSRGPAPRGLMPPAAATPTLLITGRAQALGARPPAKAIVATGTRRNELSPLAAIKSTNCLDAIMALREAAARGCDEALLRNTKGDLAEATAANLFVVIDGRTLTPGIGDGALAGVMRADLIAALDARERTLSPADLAKASEAFLTSSLGIRPLVEVDGRPIGDGRPGPITGKAQALAWPSI